MVINSLPMTVRANERKGQTCLNLYRVQPVLLERNQDLVFALMERSVMAISILGISMHGSVFDSQRS